MFLSQFIFSDETINKFPVDWLNEELNYEEMSKIYLLGAHIAV